VLVDVFDRVLDGDDVAAPVAVDQIDQCRERGRLARSGGAGHQDQPLVPQRQVAQHRREAEVLDGRDLPRDHPQRHRGQPALGERVATDPGVLAPREREVVLVPAIPDAVLLRRQHLGEQEGRVLRRQHGGTLNGCHHAIDPEHRWQAGRQ
jgi:hypothetical protein